jgi:hypothetical protein
MRQQTHREENYGLGVHLDFLAGLERWNRFLPNRRLECGCSTIEALFNSRTRMFCRQPHTDVILLVKCDSTTSAVDPDPEDRSIRNHVADRATHEQLSCPLNVQPVPGLIPTQSFGFKGGCFKREGNISAISRWIKRSAM